MRTRPRRAPPVSCGLDRTRNGSARTPIGRVDGRSTMRASILTTAGWWMIVVEPTPDAIDPRESRSVTARMEHDGVMIRRVAGLRRYTGPTERRRRLFRATRAVPAQIAHGSGPDQPTLADRAGLRACDSRGDAG
jgi:hypothetical protein